MSESVENRRNNKKSPTKSELSKRLIVENIKLCGNFTNTFGKSDTSCNTPNWSTHRAANDGFLKWLTFAKIWKFSKFPWKFWKVFKVLILCATISFRYLQRRESLELRKDSNEKSTYMRNSMESCNLSVNFFNSFLKFHTKCYTYYWSAFRALRNCM